MRYEQSIKKAGYVTLAALLALLAISYWDSRQIERGDAPALLSDGAASVGAVVCGLIFYGAVALAIFIVLRSFYLGLTHPESKLKDERDS